MTAMDEDELKQAAKEMMVAHVKTLEIQAMRDTLAQSLKYHFSNFIAWHEKISPGNASRIIEDSAIIIGMRSEAMAYLNQLGRFMYFWEDKKDKNKQTIVTGARGKLTSEQLGALSSYKDVYVSIERGGEVNFIAQKFSRHRVSDTEPRKGDDFARSVLVFLIENSRLLISDNQYEIVLEDKRFNLRVFHPKFIGFIEALFPLLMSGLEG